MMIGARTISFTVSALARHQWVADVSTGAGADGAVVALGIESRCAVSVAAAWVRVAKVVFGEGSAALEGVASVAARARANGLVILNLAVSASAASSLTWVDALKLETGLMAGAVIVSSALSIATAVWVSLVVLRTGTDSTVVLDITVGTLSTSVTAGVHADVVPAAHVVRAVGVTDALRFAASQGVANVVLNAGTHSAVVPHLAVGVAATGGWVAQLLWVEAAAAGERIADETAGAGADGLVVPGGTFGAISADATFVAGVNTPQSLAHTVAGAVIVLKTLSPDAVGEWVTFVAEGAGADGAITTDTAVSIGTTGVGLARVQWGCRGSYTDLRPVLGALNLRTSTVSRGAPTVGLVATGVTFGIDSTSTSLTHSLALLSGAPVVVGAIVVSCTLGLATIDGIAVRNEVSQTTTQCNSPGVPLAPSIRAARRRQTWVATTVKVVKAGVPTEGGTEGGLGMGAYCRALYHHSLL